MSASTPKETYIWACSYSTRSSGLLLSSLFDRSKFSMISSKRLWTKMKFYRNARSPIFLRRPNYLVKSVDKIKYSFPLPHWLSTAVSLKTNPLWVNQSVSQWPLQQIFEHSSIYLRQWNISEIGPFTRPVENRNLPPKCLYYRLWIFGITLKLQFVEQKEKKSFPAHKLYLVL